MTDPCQVCGDTSATTLVEQPPHNWVQCRVCAFAWLSPMPSMYEAADLQDADVGQSYIDGYLKKLDSKMRRSRGRAKVLKRHMPGRRLLDIGSNIGCLVAAGAELGLDSTGVEINPVLAAEAQRRYPAGRFLTGAFEEVDLEPGSFDGVYCSEVIEHVVDTNRFLEALTGVMAPGAALYLTTPALREYTKGNQTSWRDFGAPDHKLYFSPDNMRRILDKHGFGKVRLRFNFGRGLKLIAHRA
ncbi:MAG: class I SAM-dependent methyltransferase [Alphaproteobacteria bacterium]|jgi:SAM-dependent methyltransferase|nr:class I SAM-dependent methyltransferase [Rhodospirillaceae bacterium]MDG2481660.1 class I SAM-dependent methyltransferase [Alphaproteobacteria bacterium]MBT6204835.1 class I SAM-dependent methyltransferase [Rhodospirillaceae bacterium]MBT6510414.1 class I SAM-dependent methyltransferase [Rhodospirillaceae bacterium]MBT7615359.1 class I SAM-dependent methyltransferase [Rhodospirillaceae bacterium]